MDRHLSLDEAVSRNAVIKILDDTMEIAKVNWGNDEVLVDMIVTIRDNVLALNVT